MTSLLRIDQLSVSSLQEKEPLTILDQVSLVVEKGEVVGLVGESGSGKTTLALAVLGLLPTNFCITSGDILYGGRSLREISKRELRTLRGRRIGMVFQEPSAALNPVMRVGAQLCEGLRFQRGLDRKRARRVAVNLLEEVRIDQPQRCLEAYPHELSGGMQQRVLIAAALAGEPELLICDEPTSSLDAGVGGKVLDLLKGLQGRRRLAVLFISHDWDAVVWMSDRVAFIEQGRIRGESTAEQAEPTTAKARGKLSRNGEGG